MPFFATFGAFETNVTVQRLAVQSRRACVGSHADRLRGRLGCRGGLRLGGATLSPERSTSNVPALVLIRSLASWRPCADGA